MKKQFLKIGMLLTCSVALLSVGATGEVCKGDEVMSVDSGDHDLNLDLRELLHLTEAIDLYKQKIESTE